MFPGAAVGELDEESSGPAIKRWADKEIGERQERRRRSTYDHGLRCPRRVLDRRLSARRGLLHGALRRGGSRATSEGLLRGAPIGEDQGRRRRQGDALMIGGARHEIAIGSTQR